MGQIISLNTNFCPHSRKNLHKSERLSLYREKLKITTQFKHNNGTDHTTQENNQGDGDACKMNIKLDDKLDILSNKMKESISCPNFR